jgi:hypothetical protein
MEQERNRIIDILQRLGLLCKSEEEVCNISKQGHGCNCGQVYKEIWEQ